MLTESDFIRRIDPFSGSDLANFDIPRELRLAAEKLPSILENGG
jgi:hypothetical protein